MAASVSQKPPLKDGRIRVGRGKSGRDSWPPVTGSQSDCGDRGGHGGRARGREGDEKLFPDGVRLGYEGPWQPSHRVFPLSCGQQWARAGLSAKKATATRPRQGHLWQGGSAWVGHRGRIPGCSACTLILQSCVLCTSPSLPWCVT